MPDTHRVPVEPPRPAETTETVIPKAHASTIAKAIPAPKQQTVKEDADGAANP